MDMNEGEQIGCVLLANFKQQLTMLEAVSSLGQQVEREGREAGQLYEQFEDKLGKWMILLEENQLLLKKYYAHFRDKDDIARCSQFQLAISTQLFIKQSIQVQGARRWPIEQSKLILWVALQKYNLVKLLP